MEIVHQKRRSFLLGATIFTAFWDDRYVERYVTDEELEYAWDHLDLEQVIWDQLDVAVAMPPKVEHA